MGWFSFWAAIALVYSGVAGAGESRAPRVEEEFRATGRQLIFILERWRAAEVSEVRTIELDRLREVSEQAKLRVSESVILRIDRCRYHPEYRPLDCSRRKRQWQDLPVMAANDFKRGEIEISADLWDRSRSVPHLRYATVLHEYLALVPVQDRLYELSAAIVQLFERIHSEAAFKRRMLEVLVKVRPLFEEHHRLNLQSSLLPVEVFEDSVDVQECLVRGRNCAELEASIGQIRARSWTVVRERADQLEELYQAWVRELETMQSTELTQSRQSLVNQVRVATQQLADALLAQALDLREEYGRSLREACLPKIEAGELAFRCLLRKFKVDFEAGAPFLSEPIDRAIEAGFTRLRALVDQFKDESI